MKKLLILLCLPFAVYAGEPVLGVDTGNDNPGYGGKNALHVNSSGQVTQTLQTHEDETNSVGRFEQQFSSSTTKTADYQVKAAPGFVHAVTCNSDATATAGTIILHDSLTESGTAMWTWTVPAVAVPLTTIILDMVFSTGIYLGFTTTTDVQCTVSYR